MKKKSLDISIEFKLWLKIYLNTVIFLCAVFDCQPDEEKLRKMIKRGCKLKTV